MNRSQEITISLGILTGSGISVEMKRVRLSPEGGTRYCNGFLKEATAMFKK